VDKLLRSQTPQVELAMRYAIRGYFRDGDRERDVRILELLKEIKPTPDEHAAILKHSTEIGAVIETEFNQK
jgi:hypothetical protein